MPKVDGPREGKRKMLCAVEQSIILYDTQAWSEAIKMKKYKNKLRKIQRKIAM